jgi:hypothetical protein
LLLLDGGGGGGGGGGALLGSTPSCRPIGAVALLLPLALLLRDEAMHRYT